jgi:hypothetical protein
MEVTTNGNGPGRKYTVALIWGAAMIGVLLILLGFGVRSDVILGAWLAAFVAIPVQFTVGNVAVSKAYATVEAAKVTAPVPQALDATVEGK